VERALITGSAGFIGSHLAEALLASGVAVRGIDRLSDYYAPAVKRDNLAAVRELGRERFEFIEADLAEPGVCEAALAGVTQVFHLAGQPGVRPSWGENFDVYNRDNLMATQRLLEAAVGRDLHRFVIASSSSVYGNAETFPTSELSCPAPISPYGVTKLAAEQMALLYHEAFEVPSVSLRYFTIFGPRQRPDMAFHRFISAALSGDRIQVYGDGRQIRDLTYVSDCVEATIAAGERAEPGGVYNVAGGNCASVRDVLDVLQELSRAPLSVAYGDAKPGDARRTGASTERLVNDLSFTPCVSLEEGLRREYEWLRAKAADGEPLRRPSHRALALT
jgi:UDP-glucuronate 4-epimerase